MSRGNVVPIRNTAWRASMRMKPDPKTGRDTTNPLPTVGNVALILAWDEAWRGVLGYDEFSGRVVVRQAPPLTPCLEPSTSTAKKLPRNWEASDVAQVEAWLSTSRWGMHKVKRDDIKSAAMLAAEAHAFHPVREYLARTEWDGIHRLDTWTSKYLGSPDTEYERLVGRLWLISAVARVMEPGCKADYVLILEGGQGAGKSTALRILFGDWFLDTPIDIGSKDAMLALRGVWGVEMAELDSLVRADPRASKAFFSGSEDKFRKPYGENMSEVPRQCVIAGTVNPGANGYLTDETGARRFWPVVTTSIDVDALRRDRDQIWAEALSEYRDGRPWYPDRTNEAQRDLLASHQVERYRGDSWDTKVTRWVHSAAARRMELESGGWELGDVLEFALGLDTDKWGPREESRVGKILSQIGCKARRVRVGDSRPRLYTAPPRLEETESERID